MQKLCASVLQTLIRSISGTRVTFAGRPVGEVVLIQEIPDARTSRVGRWRNLRL